MFEIIIHLKFHKVFFVLKMLRVNQVSTRRKCIRCKIESYPDKTREDTPYMLRNTSVFIWSVQNNRAELHIDLN